MTEYINNMTLFDFVSWYIIIGCLNIIAINLILDWADRRGGIVDSFQPYMGRTDLDVRVLASNNLYILV